MSIPYFYEPFVDFSSIHLSEQSIHHAVNVLRMRAGELLVVVNGKGLKAKCCIDSISKKDISLTLIEQEKLDFTKAHLHIAIAFTKNAARIEWFLEKATEMGIQTITPLISQRSEKIYLKKERFEKILIAAMLQSQQAYLPVLQDAKTMAEMLNRGEEQKFIAHCEDSELKLNFLDALQAGKNTLIFIGPEGDFSKDEIHLCLENCKAVTLGPTRLRTETAGIYACAVFNAKNFIQ